MMNKNVIVGVGLIAGGIILAKVAANKGKVVPFLGKIFPPKIKKVAPAK